MRTITQDERVERARIHLRILEAKAAIADERACIAQIKATRAANFFRKAEDRAMNANNVAIRLGNEVDRALAALDALTQ